MIANIPAAARRRLLLVGQAFTLPGSPHAISPSLPQRLVGLTGIRSWPLASLVFGASLYVMYLLLVIAGGNFDRLFGPDHWWYYDMLPSIVVAYLLLIYPLVHRLAISTVEASRPYLPDTVNVDLARLKATRVNPTIGYLAVTAGVLVGMVVVQPWRDTSQGTLLTVYGIAAHIIMWGMLGYTLYSGLYTTQFLAGLCDNIRVDALYGTSTRNPLTRWSLGGAGLLVLGLTLATLFSQSKFLLQPEPLILNGVFLLAVVFFLLRGGLSLAVLTRYRVIRALVLFVGAILLGTLGYYRIQGWPLLDGLFMSVITMTTIGFSEVHPLNQTGKIFTILLSLVSVGIAGYTVSAGAAFIIGGDMERVIRGRKMDKQIARLDGHIILCGAGGVGQQVAAALLRSQISFVVIDTDENAIEAVQQLGAQLVIQNDATRDASLREAGIERAAGIVVALSDDKDTAFVILSARSLNPKLRIVARLVDEEHMNKLRRVGADQVVLPDAMGGQRMAALMTHPATVDLVDDILNVSGQSPRLAELTPAELPALSGQTLAGLDLPQRTGVQVVGVRGADGTYHFSPDLRTQLGPTDTLLVYGTPAQLAVLRAL